MVQILLCISLNQAKSPIKLKRNCRCWRPKDVKPERVFFSHNLENFPKQDISLNLHISQTVGTLSQAPLMKVQSQCCFSIYLYQFRGFGLLAWGNRNLVLGRTGGGSQLTGKFFHAGRSVFFQMGRMSKFLAGCPPQCGKVYVLFSSPLLDTALSSETCNTCPTDPHHKKITDSMMIHQNQGD